LDQVLEEAPEAEVGWRKFWMLLPLVLVLEAEPKTGVDLYWFLVFVPLELVSEEEPKAVVDLNWFLVLLPLVLVSEATGDLYLLLPVVLDSVVVELCALLHFLEGLNFLPGVLWPDFW
jgi:hypothetical protein